MDKTQGKIKLITFMLFITILLAMVIYANVVAEQISPEDEFYGIKGGNVDTDNITFIINGTPSSVDANITNITIWTNISGTWKANYTNDTSGTAGEKVNRIFPLTDTSIFNLSNGLRYVWGAQVCDNKSFFIDESINLDTNAFGIVFDNTSSDCGVGGCNYTVKIEAGIGHTSNFPVSTLDGVSNSTTGNGMSGACMLNNRKT